MRWALSSQLVAAPRPVFQVLSRKPKCADCIDSDALGAVLRVEGAVEPHACHPELEVLEVLAELIPTPNRWPAGVRFLWECVLPGEASGEWFAEREDDVPEGFLLVDAMSGRLRASSIIVWGIGP